MPIQTRPLLSTVLATLAVLLTLAVSPANAARRALVVGNDNYTSVAKLRNARADAEAMADAFRRAGYEVDLVTDRNLKQLQADVRNFRQKVASGDEVVVFFSGHGVQLGGTNYLLPTDVGAQNEDQVKDDALSLSGILEGLRERKPRFTLAIVDACRDNPFAGNGKAIGGRGLTGVAGASGQMVIYAAGEGQKALDRLGNNDTVRNGLFTRVFLKEINKPGVPIRDVLYRVRDEVATLAEGVKHEQVPAVYDQVRGTFYFLAPPSVGGQAAVQPQPPSPVATVVPEPVRPAPEASRVAERRAGDVFKDCNDCPEMVVIPAGSFVMGSTAGVLGKFGNEAPPHTVSVRSFGAGKFEVTFDQWHTCVKSGGCAHKPLDQGHSGPGSPVIDVSWEDAQQYVKWLSAKTGQTYRLLSEAEWEYAARAGTTSAYPWGQQASHEHANYGSDQCCKPLVKGRDQWDIAAPVGQFPANAFGLHDMHGNVREWVHDVWHSNYNGAPTDGSPWTSGGDSARRVLRGGSWSSSPWELRSDARDADAPGARSSEIGFRVARTL